MQNSNYIEFSKIYKRVMDVELRLKRNLKIALKIAYPTSMFSKLHQYIETELKGKHFKWKKGVKRDILFDLLNANKTQEEKLDVFINTVYLSDVINILIKYPKIYKDKKFIDNFYKRKINFNEMKQNASLIIKLRNIIMHFNVSDYKLNKNKYISSLMYWEQILNCTNCNLYNLKFNKVTTKKILQAIKDNCLDFKMADDRYLCDLFDDIAIMNGLPVEKLPKYWTIGRQIFELKKQD